HVVDRVPSIRSRARTELGARYRHGDVGDGSAGHPVGDGAGNSAGRPLCPGDTRRERDFEGEGRDGGEAAEDVRPMHASISSSSVVLGVHCVTTAMAGGSSDIVLYTNK